MAISTLVDLVVGRAQADGAVVVAFFGLARRHFLRFVDRVAQALFWATGVCAAVWPRGFASSTSSRGVANICAIRSVFLRTVAGCKACKCSHQFVLLLASVLQPLAFLSP